MDERNIIDPRITDDIDEMRFEKEYNADDYDRLSLTIDVLVFTESKGELMIVLTERDRFPFKGFYSLPGTFIEIDETANDAAERVSEDKIGISGIEISQLGVYSAINRDPRTRVVSIAMYSLVPYRILIEALSSNNANDDITLFDVVRHGESSFLLLEHDQDDGNDAVTRNRIAFDHSDMISDALVRMNGRADYTNDAFKFLDDKNDFTVTELRYAFEAMTGRRYDAGNFRHMFDKRYLSTDKVTPNRNGKSTGRGRPASSYRFTDGEQEQ